MLAQLSPVGFAFKPVFAIAQPRLVRFGEAPASSARRKILLMINPQAGGVGDSPVKQQIETALAQFPAHERERFIIFQATRDIADLHRTIAQHQATLGTVVAAGGDGTIRQMIKAVLPYQKSGMTVGILPMGTGNLFATEMGIPTDLHGALNTVLHGKPFPTDVVMFNDREVCIMMGGCGLDADTMAMTTPDEKRRWKKLAYIKSALVQLVQGPIHRFEIEADGKHYTKKGTGVLIANAGNIFGPLTFTPGARPDDGLVDVAVLGLQRKLDYIKILWQLLTRSPQKITARLLQGVSHFKAKEITIRTNQPVRAEVDGDVIGTTPLSVKILPKAVSILIPANANPFGAISGRKRA